MWLSTRLDTCARQKAGTAAQDCASFIAVRVFCLAGLNVPKAVHSCFHDAGVIGFVVAQPMEDLSAVSITDKTVGIRLSRLRRGAEVVPGPAGHPNDGLLCSFLCTWWGGGEAERSFRPQEKTERRPNR